MSIYSFTATSWAWQKGKGQKLDKSSEEPSDEKVAGLVKTARASAASLLEQLSKAYDEEHHRLDPADAKWLATVRRSGTTADKLAAWTVVIQENLPANLRSLMSILQLCSLKGKRQAAQAIEVRPGKHDVNLSCARLFATVS